MGVRSAKGCQVGEEGTGEGEVTDLGKPALAGPPNPPRANDSTTPAPQRRKRTLRGRAWRWLRARYWIFDLAGAAWTDGGKR